MDPEELRRKRMRKFNSPAPTPTPSTSSAAKKIIIDLTDSPPPPAAAEKNQKMDDDEKLARDLQVQYDAEHAAAPPDNDGGQDSGLDSPFGELFLKSTVAAAVASYSTTLTEILAPPAPDDYVPFSLMSSKRRRPAMPPQRKPQTDAVVGTLIDTSEAGSQIKTLHSFFKQLPCKGCSVALIPAGEAGTTMLSHDIATQQLKNGAISCKKCSRACCLGCGAIISTKGIHCDQHRIALIFYHLCGFDSLSKHNKPVKAKKSTEKRNAKSSGIGYGGMATSSGFDTDEDSDDEEFGMPGSMRGTQKPYQEDVVPSSISQLKDEDDRLTARVMEALADLLPSLERASAFDQAPPAALLAVLSRSSVLDRAAELLMNNSVENVTSRAPLYHALVRFVSALASHTSTGPLVHQGRSINRAGHNLLRVALAQPTRLSSEENDLSRPLAVCMRDLAKQCHMIAKSTKDESQEDPSTWLFRCISTMASSVHANESAIGSTNPIDAIEKVAEIPDQVLFESFCYSREAGTMATTQVGRTKHIFREITTLQSSLPDGIYLRYAEGRPDCMKILITGPRDSPYAFGLFEFDLICPPDYPQVPPKMLLKTTGGNTVHFNPNLYENGKVCLSLLGTWNGPGWEPRKSTIHQLLVSIQGMILCEKPYANEPGREKMEDSPQSMHYNREMHGKTVETAMLGWLTGSGTGIWDDVVRTHFQSKQDQIIEKVDAWVKDQPPADTRRRSKAPKSNPFSSLFGIGGSGNSTGGPPFFPAPPFAGGGKILGSNPLSGKGPGGKPPAAFLPQFSGPPPPSPLTPTHGLATAGPQYNYPAVNWQGTGWGGQTLGGQSSASATPLSSFAPLPPNSARDKRPVGRTDNGKKKEGFEIFQDLINKLKNALIQLNKPERIDFRPYDF